MQTGPSFFPLLMAGLIPWSQKNRDGSDAVADSLVLSLGEKKHVDLALSPVGSLKFESSASPPPVKASSGAMEFNDEPNFTVAGVTDWSNLGLHGSAASSKTSESLAKETLTLKSSEPEIAPAGKSGKQYEVALAYRAKGDLAEARQQVRNALAKADDAEGHRLLGELDERLNEPWMRCASMKKLPGWIPASRTILNGVQSYFSTKRLNLRRKFLLKDRPRIRIQQEC